jgi:hypothetical protein
MKIATIFSCLIAMGLPALTFAQTWDPLTTLDANSMSGFSGPLFDSLGNAWMAIGDNVSLSAIESNGTSGSWGAPHILAPAPTSGGILVTLAADQSGDVYAVYLITEGGQGPPYSLMWAEYSPASGWTAPALAYNSQYGFDTLLATMDSAGRLVVAFNPDQSVSSIVYDPATSSWGPVQQVSGKHKPVIFGMAGNTSGSQLALAYFETPGVLLYSLYDQATAKWGRGAEIPGSENATFVTGAADTHMQMAVDSSGNVTVVSEMSAGRGEYTVEGFRYDGSTWQATTLYGPSPYVADLENGGSTALNSDGAVLVDVAIGSSAGTSVLVFQYTPGVGWDTETAATYESFTETKCGIAWFASDEAVATYANFADGGIEQAAIYSNGAWASGPPIPGGYGSSDPGLATAPNGDLLLGMTADEGANVGGIVVTWLRP